MAYKALYRSYRPKDFMEMVGQKHIVKTIQNAIIENKIAHAYLFSGPRGTGKTSMAKILAKALNCESTNKPCNQCENCKQINLGTHPDVIEIDAASNNGVDEVRDLIDKVKYIPSLGKYKIYIIDEVHMMTPGAFNALLKTLEEPPSHVVFILATTDVHKVIPTIISRCQRFDFGRVNTNEIRKKIAEILVNEGISFEENALDLIAELAEGGMRDAISILDQTIAYAGGCIEERHIRDIYGIASTAQMVDFLCKCNEGLLKDVLLQINDFETKGIDFARLTVSLIDILKETIIYLSTRDAGLLKNIDINKAMMVSNGLTTRQLFSYIDILIEAQSNYRKVNSLKDFFQLAVLKITRLASKVEKNIGKIEKEVLKESFIKEENNFNEEAKEKMVHGLDNKIAASGEEVIINTQPKTINIITSNQPHIATIEEKTQTAIPNTAIVLEKIGFNRDDIFNVYAKATKLDKSIINDKWSLIKKYLSIPAFSKAANLIIDGQPIAVCKNAMVVVFEIQEQAEEANIYQNQLLVRQLFIEMYGKEYFYYAVSNENYKLYKLEYMNIGGSEGFTQFEIHEPVPVKKITAKVESFIQPKVENDAHSNAHSLNGDNNITKTEEPIYNYERVKQNQAEEIKVEESNLEQKESNDDIDYYRSLFGDNIKIEE